MAPALSLTFTEKLSIPGETILLGWKLEEIKAGRQKMRIVMKHCEPREVHALYPVSDSWSPKHRRVAKAPVLILLPLLFCSSVPFTAHSHHLSPPLLQLTPTPHCRRLALHSFSFPRSCCLSISLLPRPIFLFKFLLFLSFSF